MTGQGAFACDRCGRPLTADDLEAPDGWVAITVGETPAVFICPDCTTVEEHAEAEVTAAAWPAEAEMMHDPEAEPDRRLILPLGGPDGSDS